MAKKMVYVLLQGGQPSPVGIFDKLEVPDIGIPKDAKGGLTTRSTDKYTPTHRDIVGEWKSEICGTTLRLVAYVVL